MSERVLICGGRHFNDGDAIYAALNDFERDRDIEVIIQGGATGADAWAKRYAEGNKIPCREFLANWKKHGKAAGPIRNERMIEQGKPTVVIAFPGGRGTADMVERAKQAGIEVIEVRAAPTPQPEGAG